MENICSHPKKNELIRHYFLNYKVPEHPPSWMLLECLSFGACTSLFRHLHTKDQKAICKVFDYHLEVVESCLEPLRYIRTICAHHARVWNRWFTVTPKRLRAFGNHSKPNSFHEQVCMIDKLHQAVSPYSKWKERLYHLFARYEDGIPFEEMGFKKNWQEDPFW